MGKVCLIRFAILVLTAFGVVAAQESAEIKQIIASSLEPDLRDSTTRNLLTILQLSLDNVKANSEKIHKLGKNLTPEQKRFLVEDFMMLKNKPVAPFLINSLMGCGIGSFIQGDVSGGVIQLVLEGIGACMFTLSLSSVTSSGTIEDALVHTGVGYTGIGVMFSGWAIGVIKPWMYASKKANELRELLAASVYENNVSLNMNPISHHDRKPMLQVSIPIVAVHF
jgi:hypothetical protein